MPVSISVGVADARTPRRPAWPPPRTRPPASTVAVIFASCSRAQPTCTTHEASWRSSIPARPATLIGCGAGGVIGGDQELEDEEGAVVWALSSPDAEAETMELTSVVMGDEMALGGLPEDPAELGDALIVLADPRSYSADALLRHLNDVRPAMPVLGGLASAATRVPRASSSTTEGDRRGRGRG